MSKLYIMISIVDRSRVNEYLRIFDENHVPMGVVTRAEGTASSEIEELFGLQSTETEKAVCFSIVTEKVWKSVKKDLETRTSDREPWKGMPFVNAPWTGVSFIVPLSSIGGTRELAYLTRGMDFEKGEEAELKNTIYELIITVTNIGYSDMVMEAARGAGATGGTIVHARGTERKAAEDFMGISLATERDMVFIVTTSEEKNAIMSAIMQDAGIDTKAGSIVFSLPVTATAGFKITKDRERRRAKEDSSEESAETEA